MASGALCREVEAGQMKVQGRGAEPAPFHRPLLGGLRAGLASTSEILGAGTLARLKVSPELVHVI